MVMGMVYYCYTNIMVNQNWENIKSSAEYVSNAFANPGKNGNKYQHIWMANGQQSYCRSAMVLTAHPQLLLGFQCIWVKIWDPETYEPRIWRDITASCSEAMTSRCTPDECHCTRGSAFEESGHDAHWKMFLQPAGFEARSRDLHPNN